MRLRNRLALAFLIFAVLPLAGVTAFTYVTAERAYAHAVQKEAGALAEDMRVRMDRISGDLTHRIDNLENLPFPALMQPEDSATLAARSELAERLHRELGDLAGLVSALEFTPAAPPVPPGTGDQAWPLPKDPSKIVVALDVAGGSPAGGDSPPWVLQHLGWQQNAQTFRMKVEAAALAAATAAKAAARDQAKAAAEAASATRRPFPGPKHAGHKDERGAAPAAFAKEWSCAAKSKGTTIGHLKAKVRSGQMLAAVFTQVHREAGEIPFAIDMQGHLHAPDDGRAQLEQLGLATDAAATAKGAGMAERLGDWILATKRDPTTGVTLGIARPVGPGLKEIRRTAARNFLLGLGLAALALTGVLPLSRRLTRHLGELSDGAERLAQGDLDARVAVRSRDEIGRVAETFNRMASEIRRHQERLIQQERLQKELELCRRIQEEMLPRDPLRVPFAEVMGLSLPAREVGGDFFNYFALPNGDTALLVGDVSGKGVAAAILMANAQATLRARLGLESDLVHLATELDRDIDATTPRGTYLTLFVAILDGERRRMRYINAGQNPPLLIRADGTIERCDPTGRPLGLLPGGGYEERTLDLQPGDAMFLYTDGLVEAEDSQGDPFGLGRVAAILSDARQAGFDGILARMEKEVREHRGEAEPFDDATMVILRVAPSGQA